MRRNFERIANLELFKNILNMKTKRSVELKWTNINFKLKIIIRSAFIKKQKKQKPGRTVQSTTNFQQKRR